MGGPTENVPPTSNTATAPRRRSSGWMPGFDALQSQKRTNSDSLRRQSITDQHAKGGMFSQFFHNNFGRNAK
ncbi:hypothetical protein C2857_003016 [Epichloe festucae Fl1]|uniref:Conidiation-specific expression protein n=1 Tax=Epichloe festucae (strain Fl1) TaxID=877507 RepID=A0A7S9KRX1_EPIFF|nr:hypothetical protein C2857_003016 [Epichloe festucae Fl1]